MDLKLAKNDNFIKISVGEECDLDRLKNYLYHVYDIPYQKIPGRLLLDIREVPGLMSSSVLMIAYHAADVLWRYSYSLWKARIAIVQNDFLFIGTQKQGTSEIFALFSISILSTSDYKKAVEWLESI